MTDGDPRARHEPADPSCCCLDGLDPIVDVEDLTAPIELAVDGVAHQPVIVLRDSRLDGEPCLGRRLDDGKIADPNKREVQRPRNGRRGECQHVHLAPHVLDALLVRHPKALLLVDHQQSEVGEVDVLAQDPVGPDQDVHAPVRNALEDLLLALLRDEAREHLDAKGE